MTSEPKGSSGGWVEVSTATPIWGRFFLPSPLVLIGTKEGEGFDLAPKHMAMPIGWENYFGFVCTPQHATYHNAQRENGFTVSVPKPSQVIMTSLAAQPPGESGRRVGLESLPTESARTMEGILLRESHLQLECELERVVDGFGPNSLIVGRVQAARVDAGAVRESGVDDGVVLKRAPLLVYLSPGRLCEASASTPFPFPADFSR